VNFSVTEPVERDLIERMSDAQLHRGPDDCGYLLDGNAALGHRRLSIIDLSSGGQPIYNEDGSIGVVFNGEIYNYQELSERLASQGHRFVTRSDTEVIVHSYEQYGDDCVDRFRGMFAFAIWDRRRRRLFIARDRMGIKPLYYHAGPGFLAFASEIKSLLQHPGVPRELDVQALDLYLTLRYVPGPRTMFKGIYKLEPGHTMSLDKNGLQIRRYWDIQYSEKPRSDGEAIEEFRSLFAESVKLRLISEVPLGVFLSGGLDSTSVLAAMSRINGRKGIKTFSVGYDVSGPSKSEASEANELDFAREAAAFFGAEHHEYRLTASEFRDAAISMMYHLDEPLADPSCMALYYISKLARNHITVVLSGEGADEILGGYNLYQRLMAVEAMRKKFGPVASLAQASSILPWSERVRTYIDRLSTPLEEHYRGVSSGIGADTRLALIGPERFDGADRRLNEVFAPHFRHTQDASPLNRMLYADARVWLPENLLLKADKVTMATSVELRVPFLDHKLVEFSASLSDSFKIRKGSGKWLLRSAVGKELPPSILNRPKKGFPSPTGSWLRFELRDFVHDTLLARDSASRTYFSGQAIEDIVNRHEAKKFSGYQEVWSLMVFELWHREFMDRTRAPEVARTAEVATF
jgi:asparagine synthase (glutamine-hydrolysing)